MKVLETVALKYLEWGDYFFFYGRNQLYTVTRKIGSLIEYMSTYSGRKYTVETWQDAAQKKVCVTAYGN